MLKKSQRLTTEQVNLVIEKGKILHSPLFTLRFLDGQASTKFAAVMPKRIAKTAVARNLARRRVYGALGMVLVGAKAFSGASGPHLALICKEKVVAADLPAMAKDIEALLKKAHVL